MEFIDKLQVPGLMLAGLVIWWLFRLLDSRDKLYDRLAVELSDQGKTLSRMSAILDLICKRNSTGGGGHK